MSQPGPYARGDQVRHPAFGIGEVLLDNGATVVVRFENRIEECPAAALGRVDSFASVLARPEWDPPLEVLARTLGDAIRSVNDFLLSVANTADTSGFVVRTMGKGK